MKFKITKKIFSILSIITILFSTFANYGKVHAVNTGDNVQIVNLGECERHVQYLREDGIYRDIITFFVGFYEDSEFRPAYCLEIHDAGVSDTLSYSVDVKEAYENEGVWRVIKNGYPYAGTLGLNNEKDAFFVTKQAVYAVLDGRDLNNYKGKDAYGNTMVEKIKELALIGRNGTETRYTPVINLTTTKEASVDNDEDYVSQIFKIDSSINSKDIKIAFNPNQAPTGTQVTNLSNQEQTTFNNGDSFKILIPRRNITEDLDIDIVASGNVATYPVFYSEAPNSDWQDYAVISDPFVFVNSTANLKYTPYGEFEIKKISREYNSYTKLDAGSALKGAVFELERIDGKETFKKQYTSDELGKLGDTLKLGTYRLTEIKTPDYYVIGKEGATFEFTLEYDGQKVSADIDNDNVILKVDVEKTGTVETTAGGEIEYDFEIKNTSNAPVTNMIWGDRLPSEIKTTKLITGTFTTDNTYTIEYKTNNNEVWKTLKTCSTKENNEIDISNATLGLSGKEYIEEIRFIFDGEIQKYCTNNNSTKIIATANQDLQDHQIIENHTYVMADYLQTHLEDKDEFHTIIKKEKPACTSNTLSGVLPRTGK